MPIAQFKTVLHYPFERAPIGMNLQRGAQPAAIGLCDIGRASADMGVQNAIGVFQRLEQVFAGSRIVGNVRTVCQQGM